MNLNLSWDLFILVFFAVVVAYSFIIGKNQTLKVILGTYMAILCADGIGNLFGKYFAVSEAFLKFMKLFAITNGEQSVVFFKVLVFLFFIVLISVRGLFHVDAEDNRPLSLRLIILFLMGLLSAGLMISTVLVFISGTSLIGAGATGNNILTDVYQSSRLVRVMLDYSNLWFFLPGFSFILLGVFHKKV